MIVREQKLRTPQVITKEDVIIQTVPFHRHETHEERVVKMKEDKARRYPPVGTIDPGRQPIPKPKMKFTKLQDQSFKGVVPRLYEDMVAVVFATGPSLTQEVVDIVQTWHAAGMVATFGCNDAYSIVPYLDVHYACDPPWWDVHIDQGVLDHPAVKWSQDKKPCDKYGLNHVSGKSGQGLSLKQDLIHFGGNSGFQVLNLAMLYGCSHFLLCGYNMGIPEGRQQHFFGQHPKPLSRGTSFGTFAGAYDKIQPALKERIINCTPESSLACFKKQDLAGALDELCLPQLARELAF